MDAAILIIVAIMEAATPLLLAATGELVVEKSGVLNLGVEGMMLMGAVVGVAVAVATGHWVPGTVAAAAAGGATALVFGVLTLNLMANQVASGLALTIFGTGLSAVIGDGLGGLRVERMPRLDIAGLSDLPIIGPIVFSHNLLVYLSLAMIALVAWFLYRTRAGLVLRAVGENHDSAHAIGYRVLAIRHAAVIFGGMMAGLAGASIALAFTPMWRDGMTAGRGWIALALIVFASWRPGRVLAGAYLFGAVTIAQLHAQGFGLKIPSQLLTALPYIATIVVLVLMTSGAGRVRFSAPASLGKPFHPTL